MSDDAILHLGDCRNVLPTLPDASVDAVVCDPPYPCIEREYGYWTEEEWFALLKPVVRECRRVLKPKGSAVFILQPNSERVGKMRLWLYEFILWAGREWNFVQDAHWWNISTMPVGGANAAGLLRPSLKYCIWLGPEDCYRDQASVLLEESASNRHDRLKEDFEREDCPSRVRSATEGPRDDYRRLRTAVERRGGTTPFNVLAVGSDGRWNGGTDGHPASTPLKVCDFWIKYLCPPGGVVLDPCMGLGSTGRSALRLGRRFIGIEKEAEYHAIAERLLAGPPMPLFEPVDETPVQKQAMMF